MNESDSHKRLRVYRLAHDLAVRVHFMSLELPKHEMYEEGSQIRRSAKSIPSNIIEGHALRRYKKEYVHYMMRAYGSGRETGGHLEMLYDTKSLIDRAVYEALMEGYAELNAAIYRFAESIDHHHDVSRVGNIDWEG